MYVHLYIFHKIFEYSESNMAEQKYFWQGRILWATKAITEAHVFIQSEGEPKYFIICNSEYVYHQELLQTFRAQHKRNFVVIQASVCSSAAFLTRKIIRKGDGECRG